MEIKVFDWQGNQRDLAYLQGKYGTFVIKPAVEGDGTIYKISMPARREVCYPR